jgi:hypothetical protein
VLANFGIAAIRYLNVTSSGRQWIANLYANVFRAEPEINAHHDPISARPAGILLIRLR